MSDGHGGEAAGSGFLSSVVAIVAFIILVVIVLWGLVHLTSFSRTWLGSLLTRTPAGISVMVPKTATSSEPFTVSWKYTTNSKGTYAFLYQCKSGLQMRASGVSATQSLIPCGAAYTIPVTGNSLSVTPILSGTSSVSVPVSVVFIPTATSTTGAQGSSIVTIHIPSATPLPQPIITTTANEPKPVASAPVSQPVATKRGPADLTVRIVGVGIIDPSTGSFINRTPMYGETAAVQFDISNIGSGSSGTYYFEAYLPTASGYNYTSTAQAPLSPGDHVLNTLKFTQPNPSGGNVSVTITTSDVNQYNNFVSQWMNGSGYQQTYQYQQPVYQPTYYQQNQQYQYVPQPDAYNYYPSYPSYPSYPTYPTYGY